MILVLSQDTRELTTEEVVDWARALGADCVRFNADDLTSAHPFSLRMDPAGISLHFVLEGRAFTHRDVGAVWLRRWGRSSLPAARALPGLEPMVGRMNAHLAGEANALSRAFFASLAGARWLGRPGDGAVNKLDVLRAAAEAGLAVPPTLVTNDPARIEAFRREHGRIITKSVGEAEIFSFFGSSYGLYTAEVTEPDLEGLPPLLFPTLVQGMVEKSFEVRAFYLAGDLYSAAIFSQADEQTAVDFRRYNRETPNRTVPYRLPPDVEEKLRALMGRLGYETGSIDLLRTPDGEHVFLEVNPGGHFGMVSHPCNYRLEKKVAEHLVRMDRDAAR